MAKCYSCGKSRIFGNSVSHAKNHSNRSWKPNLQRYTMVVKGETKRVMMCTRCLRTLAKVR